LSGAFLLLAFYLHEDKRSVILRYFYRMQKRSPLLVLFVLFLSGLDAQRVVPLALASLDRPDTIGYYGFIDSTGTWAIQPQFTYFPSKEITYGFNSGLAVVKNDKYWQIINTKGATIRPLTGYDFYSGIHDGRILVNQYGFWDKRGFINDGTWGYIDVKGKLMIVPKYRAAADFSDSVANVGISHYSIGDAYVDVMGFVHHKPKGVGGNYGDSMAIVQDPKNSGAYTFTNKKGEVLDTVTGMTIFDAFSEGSVPAKMGQKYGYINKKGDTLIAPQFDWCGPFHEGLAFMQVDKKFGFIDTSGKMVILPAYEAARSFSHGYAAVRMKGKWGFINREGKLVIPYTFTYVEDFKQ
jgi:hypothetical protein